MSIAELKAELKERWADNAALELCLQIVDALSELPDDQMRMLTFASLMNVAHRKSIDEDLLRAVALLANTSIHALDTRLLFIDDDEREYEIEKEDLAEARKRGEFSHPETGEPIAEFEAKIIPFFVPSEKFKRLRAG